MALLEAERDEIEGQRKILAKEKEKICQRLDTLRMQLRLETVYKIIKK